MGLLVSFTLHQILQTVCGTRCSAQLITVFYWYNVLQARQEAQAQEAERRAAAQMQAAMAAAARQTQLQQLLKQKLELQEVTLPSCLQRHYQIIILVCTQHAA